MPQIKRPSARLIHLACELKELRIHAGLTPKQVCDGTGISAPTFSRIERALTTIPSATVKLLLDLYGVASPQRDALIQLAKDSTRRGWWQQYGDVFHGGFVGLEDEASDVFVFEGLLVPGLLQTPDYHRALIRAMDREHSQPEIVERWVQGRTARQALVTRPNAPNLHFVLGEAVIRQAVGGPKVMRAQLSALWDASNRANVTLQIVPFSAGAHGGLDGGFTILSFQDYDMEIGYTEGPAGYLYLESSEAVQGINVRRRSLLKEALSSKESADLLRGVVDSVKE